MKKAFTLVEILMVIAIILLLAGLLFPALQAAKEDSLKGTAITQCGQLAKAMMLYTADHDGDYAPATNYGVDKSDPARIWPNLLYPYIKDEAVFRAPGSQGIMAKTWAQRGNMTVGMNSATSFDPDGCDEEDANTNNCRGFTTAASFDKKDSPERTAIFALTPNGDASKGYYGYQFNPYNGIPRAAAPKEGPPLTADIDLVAALDKLPGELKMPVFCRYHSTRRNDGVTPVVFAGGNTKAYSAKQILGQTGILWRFR